MKNFKTADGKTVCEGETVTLWHESFFTKDAIGESGTVKADGFFESEAGNRDRVRELYSSESVVIDFQIKDLQKRAADIATAIRVLKAEKVEAKARDAARKAAK